MRLTTNGITLGYDLAGNGTAVLFLHAFPLNRRMWAAQVEALRAQARPLTVDLRGVGESDPSPAPYGLETLGADVRALAGEGGETRGDARGDGVRGRAGKVGITRAIVVGLSVGGYVAFRLIERAPEFVQALVLADTRAEPDTPEGRAGRLMLADRVEREGLAALQQFMQGLLGPTTRASRPGPRHRGRHPRRASGHHPAGGTPLQPGGAGRLQPRTGDVCARGSLGGPRTARGSAQVDGDEIAPQRADVLGAGTDQAVVGILFQNVGGPPADAADSEDRRKEVQRKSHRRVDRR